MIVVGIDPSLTATALVSGDGQTYGTTSIGSKTRGREVSQRIARYCDLTERIEDWLVDAWRFDGVVNAYIEGYSFASHGNGRDLAEFGGLLRHRLLGICNNLVEVPPTTLKKFATGKGNASKSVVGAHVAKRWGVLFDSDDLYDAYALYRFGLVAEGIVEPETKQQAEAVAAVRANESGGNGRDRKTTQTT